MGNTALSAMVNHFYAGKKIIRILKVKLREQTTSEDDGTRKIMEGQFFEINFRELATEHFVRNRN